MLVHKHGDGGAPGGGVRWEGATERWTVGLVFLTGTLRGLYLPCGSCVGERKCVCVVERASACVRVPEIIFVHTCSSKTPNERVRERELLADNSESKALILITNLEYEKLEKMDSETYNSTILVMG